MPEFSVGHESIDKAITDKMAVLAEPLIDGPPINRYRLWVEASSLVREELRAVAAFGLEAMMIAPATSEVLPLDMQESIDRNVREGYGDQQLDPEIQALVDNLPDTQTYINRRNAAFRSQDPEAPLGGMQ